MGGVALIIPACLESMAKTVGCDKQDIDNCITCFAAFEKGPKVRPFPPRRGELVQK